MKNSINDATVKYGGVEIHYREASDKWWFELDGRERSAKTLANAKAAIDAPPKEKKAPFERFEAYKCERWTEDNYGKVTVTSVAERSRYSSRCHVWIVNTKGEREKVSSEELFEITPFNDSVIVVIRRLRKQIADLNNELEKEKKKLVNPALPEPSETNE